MLNIIAWSFSEKPWPLGLLSLYIRPPGGGPWLLVFQFDIPYAGLHNEQLLQHTGPHTEQGWDIKVTLEGNASRKELAVQFR